MDERKFAAQARRLVAQYSNEHNPDHMIEPDDVYIVWQVKVLQNNKALASTRLPDGMYYELTYDGDKKRCYVDAYKKWENFGVNGAGERI